MMTDLFKNAANVTHLSLSQPRLKRLDPAWFGSLQNLICLDVSDVPTINIDVLQLALSIPSLLYFNGSGTSITFAPGIPPVDLVLPNSSSVKEITLSEAGDGNLREPDISLLCPLKHLEVLRMDRCKLLEAPYTDCPLTLIELNLNGNNLQHVPQTCEMYTLVSFYPNLERLYLRNNLIEDIYDRRDWPCLPKLLLLDLTGNRFVSAFRDTFQDNFPRLATLVLDRQTRSGKTVYWNRNTFRFLPLLKTLSVASNDQDFSNKEIMADNTFRPLVYLQVLNVDENNFKRVTTERFLTLFGTLTNLSSLSLNGCKIGKLQMNVFEHFPRLQELFLKENKISKTIFSQGAFNGLPDLKILDLSENDMVMINEHTFGADLRNRLSRLDLSENPFVCDCELLWFREWLLQNDEKAGGHLKHYTCDNFGPYRVIVEFSMPRQACLLSKEVSVQVTFICSTIVTTLTLITLLFRYRWHIRLLLYEAFRGRKNIRMQRFLENDFDYDVFVSYSSEDLPWVRDHLPQLEGLHGLRLCIHERDFMIGNNIVDNIAECVQRSKKIMMVFSKHFVLSQWCQFELSYCLGHVMDYDDVLIIVCVDDVASREMTTAMMAVLKTTTYIQWAELDDAVDAFWGQLHLALREIMQNENIV